MEEVDSRIEQYEKKIEQLSQLLNEEEAHHRELTAQLEAKISELERSITSPTSPVESSTPTATVVIPESKSKLKILEQRIVEMTVALEEKDRRIFELDSELDKLKVELNQVRVEASRVPELEATVNELDNQVASLQEAAGEPVEAAEGHELDSSSSESSGDDLRDRILELEQQVKDLDFLVTTLRAEKEDLTAERDRLAQSATSVEVEELRARVQQLEEQLEISEMNRKILRENFAIENELRVKLLEEIAAFKQAHMVETIPAQVDAEGPPAESVAEDSLPASPVATSAPPPVETEAKAEEIQGEEAGPENPSPKMTVMEPSKETTMEDAAPAAVHGPGGEVISVDEAEMLMKTQMMRIEQLSRQVDSLQFARPDPSPKACTPCLAFFSRRR